MTSGPKSEKNLDTSNISAELLLLTLSACRAGLFYTPFNNTIEKTVSVDNREVSSAHGHDPDACWSLNISELFGLPETLQDASGLIPYILESDQSKLINCVLAAIEGKVRESDCEYRIRRLDGEIRWLHSRILLGLDESGEEVRYLASMCFDITEQKREQEVLEAANLQLNQAQKFLQSALSASDIAIFRYSIKDDLGESSGGGIPVEVYNSWNFNLAQLYGFPEGTAMTPELQCQRMREEDFNAVTQKAMDSMRIGRQEYEHEYPIQLEDNSTRWLLSKCTTELNIEGEPEFVSGAVIDITDRKVAEEKTKFIATHDVLTSLPNRFMFSNLLSHTIETAKRYSSRFCVFFIDLDRFKSINDAFGHQSGDRLLIDTALRLKKCLRSSDILARISGDEFVVLAPELDNEEAAGRVARKIISAVAEPMEIQGQTCLVTASVGIAIFPDHGEDEETLLKHADSAMYIAKEAGKNNYQYYNAESTSQSLERMAMENDLRSAIDRGELQLQYQAKLDLASDAITGVEALLRWNSPKFGMVSPLQFIPMAEETGMIVPIGAWVLKTACRQMVEWQQQGLPPLCVSVNISARQFQSVELLDHIKTALDESGMAPALLELEITESMVMHHVDKALAQLHEIKNLGVKIAIDDFGTGYSSLAQLKRFPIDTLKVDRSFIREVAHDLEDQAITDAIIAMGKSLSLTIIAEGVETKEQHDFLQAHACDEMQGFYFSRPVVPQDFFDLFQKHLDLNLTRGSGQ